MPIIVHTYDNILFREITFLYNYIVIGIPLWFITCNFNTEF